ncbi:MAG TPA: glycosyltransferase family 4 protein [Pirellulales bacterium]|nr:glycosyltransferase family 4 protein [Pirellulales bacterium]
MRVCLYTDSALPLLGGQEVVVDALARNFMALGHEPIVLAPPPRHLSMADHEFPYPVLRHPRFISTRHFMEWYKHWLGRAHRQHRFDVLHCHSIYPCGYLAALCQGSLGIPTVITSHGGDVHLSGYRLSKPGMPARYARSIAAADALISISRFTYDGILQLCPTARNIVSIPNGVHLEPFLHQATRSEQLDRRIQRGEYFLFIGRLHERKGVDVLLDAMALLPARRRGLLVIAGDGDERDALEAQSARLKLQNHVRFVGAAKGSTKTWLLQNARFVVTPSRTWEAFGLVVLESYAAGRAVITTMLPGMMDLVMPGETGLLVPPESPAELAQAVGTLWEDEALAQRCGERAKRVAQSYGWPTIAERHLDLYNELIGAPALRLAA